MAEGGGSSSSPLAKGTPEICSTKHKSETCWQGAIDYFENDGFGVDPWGGRDTVFAEDNATAQEFHGMVIHEPCNYASNVAYYHDATELCRSQASLSIPRED